MSQEQSEAPSQSQTPVATTQTQATPGGPQQPYEPSNDLRRLLDKPLVRMKSDDFAALAKRNPEGMGRVATALLKMNTAELPETVFVKREGGLLRKVRCRVQLKVGPHLSAWNAKKKRNDDDEGEANSTKEKKVYSINAAGYRFINQYVGLQVITPPEVVVNNLRQPNPFVEVDPVTSLPVRVYCRKLALGPSQATGSLVATDVMIRLDLNIYLVEMILAKLKWDDERNDEWGVVGGPEDKPEVKEGQWAAWRFLPILSLGGLGVWINAKHKKMLQFLSEHMTRTKFIERVVQTMTERNALKGHPSMPGTVGDVVNDIATMEVFGWTRDWTRAELEEIEQLAITNRLDEKVDEVVKTEMEASDLADEEGEANVADVVGQEKETERTEGPRSADDEEDDAVDIATLTSEAMKAVAGFKRINGAKASKEKLTGLIGADKKLEEASLDELRNVIKEFKGK